MLSLKRVPTFSRKPNTPNFFLISPRWISKFPGSLLQISQQFSTACNCAACNHAHGTICGKCDTIFYSVSLQCSSVTRFLRFLNIQVEIFKLGRRHEIPWPFPDFGIFYEIPWLFPDRKSANPFSRFSLISRLCENPVLVHFWLCEQTIYRFSFQAKTYY